MWFTFLANQNAFAAPFLIESPEKYSRSCVKRYSHYKNRGGNLVHTFDFLHKHTHSRRGNAKKNVTFSTIVMHFQPFEGIKCHKFSGGAWLRAPLANGCSHVRVQPPQSAARALKNRRFHRRALTQVRAESCVDSTFHSHFPIIW